MPVGHGAQDALPEALVAAGFQVDVVPAYQTLDASPERFASLARELREGRVDAVTFTSTSTVRATCAALGPDAVALLARTCVASIGPITSAEARARGVRVDVEPAAFTVPALIDALAAHDAINRTTP